MPTTSRSALAGAGFTVVEDVQPPFLFEGSVLVTGEVARTTDFEQGGAPGLAVGDARRSPAGPWPLRATGSTEQP
jgi:hypothetical protein